tara:strand:- start:1656 stop:2444 length:789 start_codon:yes stop_codon:yes gene_type:complete
MSNKDKKNAYTTVRLTESNRDDLKTYGSLHNINVMNDIIEKLLNNESLYQPALAGLDENTAIRGEYKKLDKPPFAVIDTEILLCWETDSLKHWEHYEASKSSKYASNTPPDKWLTKERVELIRAVRQKIQTGYSHDDRRENSNFYLDSKENTWSKVYPTWFALKDYERQSLSRTVDDRIAALVNKGFIEHQPRKRRVQVRGQYRMNLIAINPYEWKMLRGISYLPPQQNLQLELLKSRISGEFGVAADIFTGYQEKHKEIIK